MIITSIYETIKYFDIFKYPLSINELNKFLSTKSSIEELQIILNEEVRIGALSCYNGFYSIKDTEKLTKKRIIENKRAKKLLQKSILYSTILSMFPFVKAVAISGSLSKGVAKDDADIDFFVLIEPNRLWITKTFVQIFKRFLRLFGKEEYLCANYFKAHNSEPLEERNKFTEMEILTLIPVYHDKVFHEFMETNNWAINKYPNFVIPSINHYKTKYCIVFNLFKKMNEFILNIFGNKLDNYFYKKTKTRWVNAHLKDYSSYEDFDKSIKIRKNEAKYHLSSIQVIMKEKLKDKA